MSNSPERWSACHCPHCGADLAADPIPTDGIAKGYWSANEDGTCRDGCSRPAHFSHLIGIYDQGRDRTVEWMCPFCSGRWPR